MPLFSILTPTYNRGRLLESIYKSLRNLTFKDFEWILIDDGSIDNTEEIVLPWIANNNDNGSFAIRYIKKSNGGKHTAINLGVKEANGELIVILDSDDTLPSDSLETIVQYYEQSKKFENCGGVCGLMAHHNGKLIGSGFPKNTLYESVLKFRYKDNVKGDLLEVFKTSVMKEFPFPEFPNEKFCPEALVWNRIAKKYKLLCFNKIIYYRDYLENGLTSKIVKIRMNSPIASTMTYAEMLKYDISLIWKIKSAINSWRFRYCIKDKKMQATEVKWFWFIFQPFGLLMHLNDKKNHI